MRILVIEDEKKIRDILKVGLETERFAVLVQPSLDSEPNSEVGQPVSERMY